MGHNYNVIDIYHYKAFLRTELSPYFGSKSVHFKPHNKKNGLPHCETAPFGLRLSRLRLT